MSAAVGQSHNVSNDVNAQKEFIKTLRQEQLILLYMALHESDRALPREPSGIAKAIGESCDLKPMLFTQAYLGHGNLSDGTHRESQNILKKIRSKLPEDSDLQRRLGKDYNKFDLNLWTRSGIEAALDIKFGVGRPTEKKNKQGSAVSPVTNDFPADLVPPSKSVLDQIVLNKTPMISQLVGLGACPIEIRYAGESQIINCQMQGTLTTIEQWYDPSGVNIVELKFAEGNADTPDDIKAVPDLNPLYAAGHYVVLMHDEQGAHTLCNLDTNMSLLDVTAKDDTTLVFRFVRQTG